MEASLAHSWKLEPAGLFCQMFTGGARIFPAIERPKFIDHATCLSVRTMFYKKTPVREKTAGPATHAVAGPVLREWQERRHRTN